MDRKRSSAHPSGNGSSKPLSREALRKANHSMIERRRREKINHAFSELRGMVPGLGGGGEGMKGEFKLEVLEKTVEHMRALMNRLDVLESQNFRKTIQQVEEAKPGRKRKRLASSPTTTTTSSSSNPVLDPSKSRQPISKSNGHQTRNALKEEGISEETSESSDEEPLVGRFPATKDDTKTEVRTTPLPLPIPSRSNESTTSPIPHNANNIQHHSLDRNPTRTQSHHPPTSFHLPLSRILNPSSPKRQPKPLLPLSALNSPTPSRTDSEATVLEEGLPSPGSDSGLGLGMVDGIAVRMDTRQDARMIVGVGRGDSEQPTPISSLALGHHQQTFQHHQNHFQPNTSRYPFPASATFSTATTADRSKKDLFLSTSTEMSPLSPFIIGTSSSSSPSLSLSLSNNNPNRRSSQSQAGQMFLPEPSPLLTPMIQRQSLTGLFELDPLSLPLALDRGSSAENDDEGDNDIPANVPPGHVPAATGRPSTQVDEQEAANILLALSSPESMAPTPWHSASKGASPPSGFNLDVIEDQGPVGLEVGMKAKMNADMDMEMEMGGNMDVARNDADAPPAIVPRTSSVTSSARGGRLAKSARDFLNLRDDAFGFALTHVG